jgi:hypothetical protein
MHIELAVDAMEMSEHIDEICALDPVVGFLGRHDAARHYFAAPNLKIRSSSLCIWNGRLYGYRLWKAARREGSFVLI